MLAFLAWPSTSKYSTTLHFHSLQNSTQVPPHIFGKPPLPPQPSGTAHSLSTCPLRGVCPALRHIHTLLCLVSSRPVLSRLEASTKQGPALPFLVQRGPQLKACRQTTPAVPLLASLSSGWPVRKTQPSQTLPGMREGLSKWR